MFKYCYVILLFGIVVFMNTILKSHYSKNESQPKRMIYVDIGAILILGRTLLLEFN